MEQGLELLTPNSSFLTLSTFCQSFRQEVVEIGNRANLRRGYAVVVFQTSVRYRLIFKNNVAGAVVVVARLTNRPDVNHVLGIGLKLTNVVEFFRRAESIRTFRENAGNVSVPLKRDPLNLGEDLFQLAFMVHVFREHVFIKRVSGRAMNKDHFVFDVVSV